MLVLAVAMGVIYANSRSKKVTAPSLQVNSSAIRYLPIGDSYTIGQSVPTDQRWPDQLVAKLRTDGVDMAILANPAVTGYTTDDLIKNELPLIDRYKPNFVTIQIGVNDYVQGVAVATTAQNLKVILDTVQKTVNKNKIILVTIPDYAKTPNGARFGDPSLSSAAIKNLNGIIIEEAQQRGLLAVDVYDISQLVISDPTLTANDGLHPSGKQYGLWADAIYEAIKTNNVFIKKQ